MIRTNCARCGEEIINEREIVREGIVLCYACAQGGYYQSTNGHAHEHLGMQEIDGAGKPGKRSEMLREKRGEGFR